MSASKEELEEEIEKIYEGLKLRDYWLYLLGSLVFLGGGISIIQNYGNHQEHGTLIKIFGFLVSEIGIAGIVAIIIVLTIERYTRASHQRESQRLINIINKNIFYAVFQKYIPEEVFAEVKSALINSNVTRSDYTIEYELKLPSEVELLKNDKNAKDSLFCEIESGYVITNITDKPIQTEIKMELENSLNPYLKDYMKILSLKIGDDEKEGVELSGTNDSVTGNADDVYFTKQTKTHLVMTYQLSMKAKESISVKTCAQTIKRSVDQEVWSSRIPSTGLVIKVKAPKIICLSAKANHSSPFPPTPDTTDRNGYAVWNLNHGIFPYQSIVLWWYKPDDYADIESLVEK